MIALDERILAHERGFSGTSTTPWLPDNFFVILPAQFSNATMSLQKYHRSAPPLFVQKGCIMDTNAQIGQANVSGSNTAGSSFEPAFYKVDSINEVTLVEGISARFVTGSRIMFSFVHLAPVLSCPITIIHTNNLATWSKARWC